MNLFMNNIVDSSWSLLGFELTTSADAQTVSVSVVNSCVRMRCRRHRGKLSHL